MEPRKQPNITIITVVKDDPTGLAITARSIFSQIDCEFEWVIVDGGSSELSADLTQEIINLSWVTVLSSKPLGIYNAMNIGIVNSHGKWLWFINAGDFLIAETSVKDAENLLAVENEIGILATVVSEVTPAGFLFNLISPRIEKVSGVKIANFHHQGSIILKSACEKIGLYDEGLKLAADGKLLDGINLKFGSQLNNSKLVGYTMGGRSGKFFRTTTNETQSYRPKSVSSAAFLYIYLKNKLKFMLIRYEKKTFLRNYLLRRQSLLLGSQNENELLSNIPYLHLAKHGPLFRDRVSRVDFD